jgi:hypothetical protein
MFLSLFLAGLSLVDSYKRDVLLFSTFSWLDIRALLF